jgi:YHS domain-containing protein
LDIRAAARMIAGANVREKVMPRGIARRALLTAILAVVTLSGAFARLPEIYTGILSATAVGGYDPVAYFTDGKPTPGKAEFSHTWKGITWRFANAGNRDAFKAKPEAYAPQYGGYCAWAVSQGYTAKGDPNAWSIVDGKLYLNYNADVQKTWQKDASGNITKADRNWPKVLEK